MGKLYTYFRVLVTENSTWRTSRTLPDCLPIILQRKRRKWTNGNT